MRWLRQLCDEHGIVLIADEIQTGFGRTGTMFAMEHFGVVPDLMTIAKSLAGGVPLSAVTGKAEIMDAPRPAAWAAPRRQPAGHRRGARHHRRDARRRAARARPEARRPAQGRARRHAQGGAAQIADVRGPGAMVAAQFNKPGSGEADADFTKKVQAGRSSASSSC